MSVFVRTKFVCSRISAVSRALSGTSPLNTNQWRLSKGLPVNKNAEGILTDGPDYTYLDGRPTPLLQKQKLRMIKQQNFASQIVEMNAELEFAKDRHQKLMQAEREERQKIIDNRLKPKGSVLIQ